MLTASFFSYKGGSGRTSLLSNVVPFLAKALGASPEHPIVICDCDTESAGLTYLLDCYKERQAITLQSVCNDGIPGEEMEVDNIRQHPFFKALPQVGSRFGISADGMDGTVLFIPAAKGTIKFNGINSANPLKILKRVCEDNNVAALIFDTPSGDQRAAKWSVDASKVIVSVLRITRQFRVGTRRYFQEHLSEWEGKNIILVPNAVPLKDICIDGKMIELESFKEEQILAPFEEVFQGTSNHLDTRMLEEDRFGVNEVERFKYVESVLFGVNELNDSDEAMAYARYEFLAEILGEYYE